MFGVGGFASKLRGAVVTRRYELVLLDVQGIR